MRYARIIVAFLLLTVVVSGTPVVSSAATPAITAPGVLAFTNAERYHQGLPFLRVNGQLSQVAQMKMQDLFAREYFAHEAPTGEGAGDLARRVGYEYIAVGENLAMGDFTSSKNVVDAWMDSPGHRANILATKFSEIGIAAGRGMYKGRMTWMVVQSFGLPRSICPTIDSELKDNVDTLQHVLDSIKIVVDMREALLEDTDVSRSTMRARVASYNLVAELYNDTLEDYRTLVVEYNKEVDDFNTCITNKTTHD